MTQSTSVGGQRSRGRFRESTAVACCVARTHVESLECRRLLAAWSLTPVVEYDVPNLPAQPAYFDYSVENGAYTWHCTLEDGSVVRGTTFETVLDENVPGEATSRGAFLTSFTERIRDMAVAAGEPARIIVEPTSFKVSLGEADATTYVRFGVTDPLQQPMTAPVENSFLIDAGRSYTLITNASGDVTKVYRSEVWGIGYACILLAPFRYSVDEPEELVQINRTLAVSESVIVTWEDGLYRVVDQVDAGAPAGTIFIRITRIQTNDSELALVGIELPLPSEHTGAPPVDPVEALEPVEPVEPSPPLEPAAPDTPVAPEGEVSGSEAEGGSGVLPLSPSPLLPIPVPSRVTAGAVLLSERDNLLGSVGDDLLA